MREKFKTLSSRAILLTRSPFLPRDLSCVVGELVDLLGVMVYRIEKLESSQPKETKTHGDL